MCVGGVGVCVCVHVCVRACVCVLAWEENLWSEWLETWHSSRPRRSAPLKPRHYGAIEVSLSLSLYQSLSKPVGFGFKRSRVRVRVKNYAGMWRVSQNIILCENSLFAIKWKHKMVFPCNFVQRIAHSVMSSAAVFPVSVALLLYRVHFLVLYVNGLQLTNYAEMNMIRYVNDRVRICVWCCQAFEPVAQCARQVIRDNGFDDRIRLIAKRSTELTVGPSMMSSSLSCFSASICIVLYVLAFYFCVFVI